MERVYTEKKIDTQKVYPKCQTLCDKNLRKRDSVEVRVKRTMGRGGGGRGWGVWGS